MRFVLMGVSGCGKTTVGKALAGKCDLRYIDGDDLHPAANIRKMSSGIPLDDDDRAPWLRDVGRTLAQQEGVAAIGCSALKRRYRDMIRNEAGEVRFLHLYAPKGVLAKRVADRPGHFMPASLLDSQYAALEELEEDELGQVIDIDQRFEDVVDDAAAYIVRQTEGGG